MVSKWLILLYRPSFERSTTEQLAKRKAARLRDRSVSDATSSDAQLTYNQRVIAFLVPALHEK